MPWEYDHKWNVGCLISTITPQYTEEVGYSSTSVYISLGLIENSRRESSERVWVLPICGSGNDMFKSIPEEYFVKYSYSEGTHIGAADSNRNWGLCRHHVYISLLFLWCFGGDSYPHEESQAQNLSRGERYILLHWNICRLWAPW